MRNSNKKLRKHQGDGSSRVMVPERSFSAPVRIVGIGSSAGGLEALQSFLNRVPPQSGLAFIVVQHLDPTHQGIMPELLQRKTPMPVLQVREQMKVESDTVYIIPPDKDMSIRHGILHLQKPSQPRGLRLPVDSFFRSLALDQQDRSVGVILSGMGSDGTLGVRAIKEVSGLVLVQEPNNARFDSMPRSAIRAGLADIVSPVEELPEQILRQLKRRPLKILARIEKDTKSADYWEKAIQHLRKQTGHDFSMYKRNTVYRRMERRMSVHRIRTIPDYVRFLEKNPQEATILFKELLIGVTQFFRDAVAWEFLKNDAFPKLLKAHAPETGMRAWVTGCSTGEEAYSLAVVFKEACRKIGPPGNFQLQIFATDLDDDAIAKARQGFFSSSISKDVSSELLRRYFTREEQGFRICKEIREMVIFAPHNLTMDPPLTRLDLVVCRNLLIYLVPELQKKLMTLFHFSLNPGGILFLGGAETVNGAELFTPMDTQSRIYQRTTGVTLKSIDFPACFDGNSLGDTTRPLGTPANSLQTTADQYILKRYAPSALLVNDQGDIVYVSGRTGKYIEASAGKANWNLFAMAREGLRYPLTAGFQKAIRKRQKVKLSNLALEEGGKTWEIDVLIQIMDEPSALRGLVLILFSPSLPDFPRQHLGKGRSGPGAGKRLTRQLRQAQNEARKIHEAIQHSRDEFQSANEELQSTNQDLQSTNEELTTSKEEMQSLNEELQTVNAELQAKVEELSRAANDIKNLLNSTDIATLFLDGRLNVRRFTPRITRIIKLIPSDIGRPITDLASHLQYGRLVQDARRVLSTLKSLEKTVRTDANHWFTVRIMPYRTLDDRPDGVVMTFTESRAPRHKRHQRNIPSHAGSSQFVKVEKRKRLRSGGSTERTSTQSRRKK